MSFQEGKTLAKPAPVLKYPVGARYRPWGVDSMASIVSSDRYGKTATIVYDHDPKQRHTFDYRELDKIGRVVPSSFGSPRRIRLLKGKH